MAYAEKVPSPKGDYWRGRFIGPDKKYLTVRGENGAVIRFTGKTAKWDAKNAAAAAEDAVGKGTWRPPAADVTWNDWASTWHAGQQDLAPKTVANRLRHLEQYLNPFFGKNGRLVRDIDKPLISAWQAEMKKERYKPGSIRTWHGTLHTCLEDAVDAGIIDVNPATVKRGRGRRSGGSRRSAVQAERVITSPLGILLVAERMSILSGRDDEFVMIQTGYACAMRLGELTGLGAASIRAGSLNPRNPLRMTAGELGDEALRVEWQITEVNGTLMRERPKNGSTGDLNLPPFLSRLLELHVGATSPAPCPCHETAHVFRGMGSPRGNPPVPVGAVAGAAGVSWTTAWSVLSGTGRVSRGTREKVLAAARTVNWRQPERAGAPAWHWRQSSFEALFTAAVSGELPPKAPLPKRPVPLTGEWPGTRVRGRNAQERATLRWEPVAKGMTPHGLRHSLKARMEEAGIPEIASETRLRHEIPGVSGAYRHVTPEMKARVALLLEDDFTGALDARLAMSPRSPVAVLDRLLQERAEAKKLRIAPRIPPETAEAVLPIRANTASDLRRGDWI